ncbi:MAG: LIC_12616 family protein [Fusobacterium sp.]|uniref:phage neck terminator protein n=1 Tax=Fusobacterium sp. TaxID=68766 RepID=UPI003995E0F3
MIEKIINFINDYSTFQIIPAYTTKEIPTKPFGTYSTILLDSNDYFGATKEEELKNKAIKETKRYRVIATIQFDVYGDTQLETIQKAQELNQLILYKLRYEWGRIGVGIAGYTTIKALNELIQEKYEFRNSFDIKFEYYITTERIVEFAQIIELEANKIDKKHYKGGKK